MTAETTAFATDAAFAAERRTTERAARLRAAVNWLWSAGLLLVLAFLVLYPVAMLLLGALTNTNPVVDGFGVFDLSLANFITVLANPNVHLALANSLIACGGGTALAVVIGLTLLLDRGAHQHAVQGLHRGGKHAAAVRAAAGRRRRLGDPRLARSRAAEHAARRHRHRLALQRLFDGRD